MKSKKVVALLLSLCMSLSLASCGETAGDDSDSQMVNNENETGNEVDESQNNGEVTGSGDVEKADDENMDDNLLQLEVEGGVIEGGMDENGVRYYKGIPFAASTEGENRFRDPQPVEPWEGVLDCKEYGPVAIQAVAYSAFGKWTAEFMDVNKTLENGLMSEDCLNLNVWTQAQQGENKPVIVYIHGGGNSSGSGTCEIYTGQELAQKDVVYVSINYRLGAFAGLVFTDKNGEEATGNYGVKDQIAALQWVQNNIAKFGGDPGNVTIVGQSAGSADCQTLMISPKAKGLFQRAVCMSALSYPGHSKTSEEAMADVADVLKDYTLEDLRKLSADEISALNLQTSFAVIDGEYLTQNAGDAYASGDYNTGEVMWGCVRGDGGMMGGQGVVDTMVKSVVADTYDQGIAQVFGDYLEQYQSLYPVTDGQYEAVMAEVNGAAGVMSYYNASLAKMAGDSEHKNYVYYFDRVMPDTEERMEAYGAFHTSDVTYWTNHFTELYPREWKDIDYKLGDMMSNYLVNFAATGDPNGAGLPEWKDVGATSTLAYMHFGDTSEFVELDQEKSDFWTKNSGEFKAVMLDTLVEADLTPPEEYIETQKIVTPAGPIPELEVTAYRNEAGDRFCFTFSAFNDSFIMTCKVENSKVITAFDKSGFWGADVQAMVDHIDPAAWVTRED